MHGALYLSDPGVRSLEPTFVDVAREFSPRIEVCGPREITLDLSGLSRLFGDARAIGEELRRTAADRGLRVRVAIAGTRTAARLMVRHRAGISIVTPGDEMSALAALPLSLLALLMPDPSADVLRRWGLKTLGELVALPSDDVMARLGVQGIEWQRLARGEDARPLVPAVPEERFEQSLELEWPIEGLEPLSFVLGRLMEPLSVHLQQRDRGAAVLHVRLRLVTKEVHERSLQLPAPMREARTLRTLALLDLESHPPSAAIDCVTVAVDPTPARIVQYSLLTRPLPTLEQLSTLMARLHALMGEKQCGSPASVDSWVPEAFVMKPFAPRSIESVRRFDTPRHRGTEALYSSGANSAVSASPPQCVVQKKDLGASVVTALRRFRVPIPARVQVDEGKPSRVVIDRRGLNGGRIATCAGPWRTSGAWWARGWDRDEWDVSLDDGATYRLFRDRSGDHWFVDGVVD
jgi:protein ImuB